MRAASLLAITLLCGAMLSAEERSYDLTTADLVVVGKLERSHDFPYFFDGFHYRGRIIVQEVLKGSAKIGQELPYNFVLACPPSSSGVSCDYRVIFGGVLDGSTVRRITSRGIWSLRNRGNAWTGRRFDPGFRDITYRDEAIKLLSRLTAYK
jgi:hypothetical protein